MIINQLADENGATQEELQAGNFRFGPGVKFRDLMAMAPLPMATD